LSITAGTSATVAGGAGTFYGGIATLQTGGTITVSSGEGTKTSSGAVTVGVPILELPEPLACLCSRLVLHLVATLVLL
jgi:hypothetical protein